MVYKEMYVEDNIMAQRELEEIYKKKYPCLVKPCWNCGKDCIENCNSCGAVNKILGGNNGKGNRKEIECPLR